jgi:DNA-binding response OmpR family regulator
LDAARKTHPSVILLDVEMPGLDGYSVCRELKADAALSTVPVVFMTTRARVDDRLVGLTLGADDYLIKPVDPRELLMRLDRVGGRDTARAEKNAESTVMSYEDFLLVARTRLTRTAASIALISVPGEHAAAAGARLRDEVRRVDLVATYDRTHLLLLLPDASPAVARRRVQDMVDRLADAGIDGVAAGISSSPKPNGVWIESLICDADNALVRARQAGHTVAIFGEEDEPPVATASAATGPVVIADDDPDVMRILDAQLKGAGYQTRLAFDGAQALAAIETSAPAVVILDLIMPKIGGFELLTRLNRAAGPRPKVIVLSARGREDDVTRAFSLGADDYVTKPFNPQELLARIARLLR